MNLQMKRLEGKQDEVRVVQQILEEAPRYSITISGEYPDQESGLEVFSSIPPHFDYQHKHVLGIYDESLPIGVIDLLIGYPSQEKALIGLLLISEKCQRKGLGTLTYFELEKYISQFLTIKTIRLSVVESNKEVMRFWEKVGFIRTGETKPFENKSVRSRSIILEKSILSFSQMRAD